MNIDPRTVISAATEPLNAEQRRARDEAALKKSCQNFEAIFLHSMFKAMRKTIPEGGLFEKDSSHEMYQDFLDTEMANKMAENQSTGIANQMYEQMKKLLP